MELFTVILINQHFFLSRLDSQHGFHAGGSDGFVVTCEGVGVDEVVVYFGDCFAHSAGGFDAHGHKGGSVGVDSHATTTSPPISTI